MTVSSEALVEQCRRALFGAGFAAEKRILVGYSGGLDSTVLVDLLRRLHRRGGPAIELIHVDHCMRPDSGGDAQFCIDEARRWGLSIAVERLDTSNPPKSQEEARRRRLAAIAQRALARGVDAVALAHHGDDRIESFVMHLLRGTGLDGLVPMAEKSSFPLPGVPLDVLRPLLSATRCQLEDYAAQRQLSHVTDPTNATDLYERNRVRHQIVPTLVTDTQARQHLLRTIENLESERLSADHYARRLAEESTLRGPGIRRVVFRRTTLANAPEATLSRLFLLLEPSLDSRSLHRISREIKAFSSRRVRHLTLSRCLVSIAEKRVTFEPSFERGAKDVLERRTAPVLIEPFDEGSVPFFDSQARWELSDRGPNTGLDLCRSAKDGPWSAIFDADQLDRPLELRGPPRAARLLRRHGQDDFYHQKVSKLFSARGIDADLRWRWPCLVDQGGKLLWAAGLARGGRALAGPQTEAVWRFSVSPVSEFIEFLHS